MIVVLRPVGLAEAKSTDRSKYLYETTAHDPLNTRIYTFPNGMKVYMSVYRDKPRIQTYIAFKVGSKHDPSNNTGLAHYLEHMLFKGTDTFGTMDYAKERKYLDQIIDLYESRRNTPDFEARKRIYRQIDQVSGVAAQYAIPNEYDKIVKSLGITGTNAFTGVEYTVYTNNIPSNQLENWLSVEAERFRNPVMRLFHTELEVVYEEKNQSLDRDSFRVYETLMSHLFQHHPYRHTVLGSVEHLKDPSIRDMIRHYKRYYVPNNMAICLSGDFDPESTIDLIYKYFNSYSRQDVPEFKPPEEVPINQPIIREVLGPDAASVTVGFRMDATSVRHRDLLEMADMILNNNEAGLIDLNLKHAQKVLEAGSYVVFNKDYFVHVLYGRPVKDQSLEEVKDLLLQQVEQLKEGDFPQWLPAAVVNDLTLSQIEKYQSNHGRAYDYVNTFTQDIPWPVRVNRLRRLAGISKQDIAEFARSSYRNNYVVVYKKTGRDENRDKLKKPEITPVKINRNRVSDFAESIYSKQVPGIQPAFLDFEKDVHSFQLENGVTVYYRKNTENQLFRLYYRFDMGTIHDPKLAVAFEYLKYLGTDQYSAQDLKKAFYKIGCSFSFTVDEDQMDLQLFGLDKNFSDGLALLSSLLENAKPDREALDKVVKNILKSRSDRKRSKSVILYHALYNYGMYGPNSPYTQILSQQELKKLTPEELIHIITSLSGYRHRILYYGPASAASLKKELAACHANQKPLNKIPEPIRFEQKETDRDRVFFVDYDMKQVQAILMSKSRTYNPENCAIRRLFNEYYGGGMSSVVFQTLRESRALAYRVNARYTTPDRKNKAHYITAFIGTQADKLEEAINGMHNLLDSMPVSEPMINTAKQAVIKEIQSERTTQIDVLLRFEQLKRLGLSYDINKNLYYRIPELYAEDLQTFHETYLKGKHYTMLLIGDKDKIDLKLLNRYGKVETLTLKEIFGY